MPAGLCTELEKGRASLHYVHGDSGHLISACLWTCSFRNGSVVRYLLR